eukprot:10394737-Karenia_brevis.AAC.1
MASRPLLAQFEPKVLGLEPKWLRWCLLGPKLAPDLPKRAPKTDFGLIFSIFCLFFYHWCVAMAVAPVAFLLKIPSPDTLAGWARRA